MTLLMREQEIARDNFEKGMAEGVVKGREEGIAEGVIKGRQEGREEGMAEGVVKGREEGIAEGMVRGIKNLIDSFKELEIDEKIIVQKLIEKYNLSKEEAEKYLG